MRVVIHADASPSIGTGHVIRSLAVGTALRRAGVDVSLASTRLDPALVARARAVSVEVVDRSVASRDPEWVVVDGYHLTPEIRNGLADPGVPRLIIDDLGRDVTDATMVVNQNLYGRDVEYPEGPEILAGPTYALLRPEFADIEPERLQPEVVERVLITMGGADPHNATQVAISALTEVTPMPRVRVVIGVAHPNAEGVTAAAHAAGFEVLRDTTTLAPHLAWSDIVISGCGTSVLEAARLGRPIVGVVLAENQRAVADAIVHEGLGSIAGEHPVVDRESVRAAVDRLRRDRAARERIRQLGPSLVDGRGAGRVARALLSGRIRLRPATAADADLLLALRNDPTARDASFEREPITRATHNAWLSSQLDDPARHLFIGEVGRGPNGVVRFDVQEKAATISIVLAPGSRGRGIGSRLIALGCMHLRRSVEVRHVDAWIRSGNSASVSAFRNAGFRSVRFVPGRVRMRLPLRPVG